MDTIVHEVDRWQEAAVEHGVTSAVLCDGLEAWERGFKCNYD